MCHFQACIIGARTKRILHVNVKNKYCVVCQRSEHSREHKCFRNWNKTSTSMEAAIISEGFQESIKKYNLIYGRLIGDGDSSVYKRITESAPYGPTFVVEKIECRNHLLRNYLNKIADIGKDTKLPILFRKKVTNSDVLGRFRNAVTKAIQYRTEHATQINNSMHTKAELLRKDIINGPRHIFGDHSNCEDYFCSKSEEVSGLCIIIS
ncbi:hypothetical protein RI129_010202 [Pyrocoelia pectoralis]|uniref:Mutator-like transposase domain-containing protein n=1 Tax=Pyrocoelia pectoralis TaxID=417401 RepID=A0AAN7V3X5_9COLE